MSQDRWEAMKTKARKESEGKGLLHAATEIREQEACEKELKWSTSKFLIGIAKGFTDKNLWVWAVFMWISLGILDRKNGEETVSEIIMIGGTILVTIIFLMGMYFKRGFEKFLGNSSLKMSAGANVTKNIQESKQKVVQEGDGAGGFNQFNQGWNRQGGGW